VREFVAIDGEGIADNYVLLAASTGKYVMGSEGLSTKECFDFLLSIPKGRKRTLVGFFFTYDVNMMLRDIPLVKLRQLWKHKWLYWRGYILEWTPTKSFTVCRESPRQRVTVYDVGGFFQCSFVKALRTWQAAPMEVIERIEGMKGQRDSFDAESMEEIIAYCLEECRYLVSLMMKLQASLETAALVPNTWQGAGSIAGKLLSKNSIKNHRQPDTTWGEEIHEAILHAYFGGRVELFQQGFHQTACAYDVTSAYPFAATQIPTLRGMFTDSNTVPRDFGLCRVRWNLPSGVTVSPFPFRYKKGIYWPINGEGIYHAVEVRAAQAAYGDSIEVLQAWEFHPDNDTKPFDFVHDAFKQRARFKAEGNPAEKAIKLGLNAMYGKLAQGIGYRGRPPAHRSYLWAGYLTAHCRATMLTLAMQHPEDVIMIATDGIFLQSDPEWETKEGTLGALTKSNYPVLFTAQPGVYSDYGGTVNKTRGFSLKEVGFSVLQEGFQRQGPFFVAHYSSRRFQGLGSSLQRLDMSAWRTWPEADRKLSLYPSRKWVHDYQDPIEWRDNPRESVRHYPPTVEGVSEAYIPKTPDLENPGALEFMELQEQPDPGEAYHVK
jgi:DNA polymerase type B, organellar and viral